MIKRIYLVDDDADDLIFIKGAFERYRSNIEIKTFSNGLELVTSLKDSPVVPIIVLMDLNMPVMSGLEALKLIRKLKYFKNLNIIIFSTSNSSQERTECLKYGATDYLCKPCSIEEYENIASRLYNLYADSFSKEKYTSGSVQKSPRSIRM